MRTIAPITGLVKSTPIVTAFSGSMGNQNGLDRTAPSGPVLKTLPGLEMSSEPTVLSFILHVNHLILNVINFLFRSSPMDGMFKQGDL